MTRTADHGAPQGPGALMEEELHSQPTIWEQAMAQAQAEDVLPSDGARVAVIGCGTSWFMAQSFATARESASQGVTDAFAASEAFLNTERQYDAVIAITRSGTTTEVLDVLSRTRGQLPSIAVVGDADSPIVELADRVVALPYADEKSVVQTRFATATLVYLLTSLGMDLSPAAEQAVAALAEDTERDLLDAEQITFLGSAGVEDS